MKVILSVRRFVVVCDIGSENIDTIGRLLEMFFYNVIGGYRKECKDTHSFSSYSMI